MDMFGYLFFPIWMILFMIPLILIFFILWIWVLVDCLLSDKLTTGEKIIWIIVIFLFNFIGALLYLIFRKDKRLFKVENKKGFKGKKLYKSRTNKILAGVCGGLGEYFNIDPTLIRLLWIMITFFTMLWLGIIAYIIAMIIIPEKR
jgi:phage shock protein PspC (stress-responsive transcriptional regulator)